MTTVFMIFWMKKMISEFYRGYSGSVIPRTLDNGESFSGCCGSRYYVNPRRVTNNRGIALYPGKKFKEGVCRVNTIKHVSTPNGDITIVTRDTV